MSRRQGKKEASDSRREHDDLGSAPTAHGRVAEGFGVATWDSATMDRRDREGRT